MFCHAGKVYFQLIVATEVKNELLTACRNAENPPCSRFPSATTILKQYYFSAIIYDYLFCALRKKRNLILENEKTQYHTEKIQT